MSAELSDALVLRAVDYRDADRIVTLLTESHGKVAVLARSARRSKKRFGGSLEPYALIEAEVRLGRGEVGSIAKARVKQSFPAILSDLTRMSVAAVALELVREALPTRQPEPEVFALTMEFLAHLADMTGPPGAQEQLLLAFEVRCIGLLGFAPNLDTCARCGRWAEHGQAALFDPAAGSVICRSCGGGPMKLSGETRRAMARAITPEWSEAGLQPLADASRGQLRRAISGLVEYTLGRPLRASASLAQILEIAG